MDWVEALGNIIVVHITFWLLHEMLPIWKIFVTKAGFILRTQIYALYADHFAHVGRVFSATNADLRRSDRADAEYKHSYNMPTFTLTFARLLKLCWPGNVDAGLSLAKSPRPLPIRRLLRGMENISISLKWYANRCRSLSRKRHCNREWG